MNITMTMTLDGLIRALRWKEHDLAERIEAGYARDASSIPSRLAPREVDRAKGDDDDRRRR
jgi:hypothetical protein